MPITIEGEAEHPDVTALKQRVREVATTYAKKHHWCREVQRALAEAGITDDTKVYVEVQFRLADEPVQTTTVRVPRSDLVGKQRAAQHNYFVDLLSPEVKIGRTTVKVPVNIVDLNLVEQGEAGALMEGYVLRYTSNEGKVQHIVHEPALLDPYWAYSECGTRGSWVEESTRSEDRVCVRCAERHANRSD